ncbi:MAG: c-type cytochrome [Terriglobia bacterium]
MRLKSEDDKGASSKVSFAAILAAWLLFSGRSWARPGQASPTVTPSAPTAGETVPPLQPGSAARGEALFLGTAHFARGGPACASCHSIAGLPFPNGGTLGPNLTGVYKKLGPHGMQVSMQTLFFHVMTPIYEPHPLTLEERSDLVAFFKQGANRPKEPSNTGTIALIAFVGFLILLAISGFAWRHRLRSVRRGLVERAMREGGTSS